tara:strand:- start:1726 stop:2031 length:306 start_codon:yes stop_codon:yes gene_type:complete
MTFKRLIPLAALVAAFFWTPVSKAEKVSCPPREMLVQSLKDAGMLPVWRAWSDRGHVTEIWVNKASEEIRWVAVVHFKSNYSCVVDQGVNAKFMGREKVAI